jgi:glycosyltransferase involved in cell wall biosynthesis
MCTTLSNCSAARGAKPRVWYVAAGYGLPAGVEAYLLHYATELRRHGFDTRIIVFERLPRVKHRYLAALAERGIPIESLYARSAGSAWLRIAVLGLPWLLYTVALKRQRPHPRGFVLWMRKYAAVRRLRRMIAAGQPEILHVKARLIAEAWPVFPPERTVYQHALSGALDATWTPWEVDAFRGFLNRVARVFAPGLGVAETLAREVGVTRPIDALFTMAPDECGKAETGNLKPESAIAAPYSSGNRSSGIAEPGNWNLEPRTSNLEPASLRFGILCRFAPQKGIVHILDALRMYRDLHGDIDFTFAGQGDLEAEIRQFSAAHRLARVRVVPVPSSPEVLAGMDVFVHPGLDDAMPVSIVEALMCGVPCVATRVGGVPDLVRDGVEGFLIEPGAAEPILRAMERFAAMPSAEFAAFRRRARARYEECCTPERVGALVARHYHAIMRAGAASKQDAGP